jgi:hypothetical protein
MYITLLGRGRLEYFGGLRGRRTALVAVLGFRVVSVLRGLQASLVKSYVVTPALNSHMTSIAYAFEHKDNKGWHGR